jgi:hypothetical protein
MVPRGTGPDEFDPTKWIPKEVDHLSLSFPSTLRKDARGYASVSEGECGYFKAGRFAFLYFFIQESTFCICSIVKRMAATRKMRILCSLAEKHENDPAL